jgi:hypothetical protein
MFTSVEAGLFHYFNSTRNHDFRNSTQRKSTAFDSLQLGLFFKDDFMKMFALVEAVRFDDRDIGRDEHPIDETGVTAQDLQAIGGNSKHKLIGDEVGRFALRVILTEITVGTDMSVVICK